MKTAQLRNSFVNAYQWLTGCTVNEALIQYARSTYEYITSVINLYREYARENGYED